MTLPMDSTRSPKTGPGANPSPFARTTPAQCAWPANELNPCRQPAQQGPHLLQASGVGGGDGRNTELRLARMHTACLGPQGLVLFPLEGGLCAARSLASQLLG